MANPLSGVLIKSGLQISRKVIPNATIPYESQEKTLRILIKKTADTAFGRKYGFKELIKSTNLFHDFKQQVPIHDYDKIFKEWWYRNLEGEEDVAWKGKISYFALSSGTTGAPSKYIPITNEMIRSIRLAGVKMYSGLTISDLPIQQYSKKVLLLGGNADLNKNRHYFYGDLTGILVHKLPVWMTKRYKPGLKIASIKDYHEKMLAIAKEAHKWDIGFISGIPSWTQMMLEYVLEYNRIDNIHEIWPNLKVYAHGGTAFTPYKLSIQSMMCKPLIFLDGYLASEGFVAYQNKVDAKGMVLNYNCGLYFEFVPFTHENFDDTGNIKPEARVFSIHEVEEGKEYAILLTTCAGAWRYFIGDTIKFVDLANSELIITGRTKHFLSICGEHLSVDNMSEALDLIQQNLNIRCREFCVAGIKSGSHFRHKWYISCEPADYSDSILAKELDYQLKKVNDDYTAVRKAVLNTPEVVVLPPTVFYNYLESKGKIGGQSKFPRVMSREQFTDWEEYVNINYKPV
jgi:hypothetical protein